MANSHAITSEEIDKLIADLKTRQKCVYDSEQDRQVWEPDDLCHRAAATILALSTQLEIVAA